MSHNNNRKRSRWGDRSNAADHSSSSGVSDQDALNALLDSAKSNEEKLKPPPRTDTSKRPRRDGDHPQRPRDGGGVHRDIKQDSQDHSYSGRSDREEIERREFGKSEPTKEGEEDIEPMEKEKPNFGLSGALAQEQVGDLKFREPPEARAPNTQWRFYVFKNDKALETLHISKQSAYLFGRNEDIADIPVMHPSASGQHAVLQYRALPGKEDGQLRCKPYLMDLESTNGSFVNGVKLDPARYYELKKGDVLKFGASTREYVLLTENTTSIK